MHKELENLVIQYQLYDRNHRSRMVMSQSVPTPYRRSVWEFSYVCGANLASFSRVSSSSNFTWGTATLNGVKEIFAAEGGVLNGNDIAMVERLIWYFVGRLRSLYLIPRLSAQAIASRVIRCGVLFQVWFWMRMA
jgi:hypothetical protein